MKKEVIKEAVKEAIVELMETPEGKSAFGPLVYDAIGQWLQSYEIEMEKHHPGGAIEVVKQRGDILAHIAHWIKNSEGAIRGVQADAAEARNRSAETRDIIYQMAEQATARKLIAHEGEVK